MMGKQDSAKLVVTKTSVADRHKVERCKVIKASVADAGFADKVSVFCGNSQAHLGSVTYPGHTLMACIVGSNEQVPVPAMSYTAPIALEPVMGDAPQTRDSSLAVAANGVPIFDYTSGGEMKVEDLYHHQTRHDTILSNQLDECRGHAGLGDDRHYHKAPICMFRVTRD
jgi:hypothetical protein